MNPFNILRYVPLWLLILVAQFAAWWLSLTPNKGLYRTVSVNLLLAFPELSAAERKRLAHDSLARQFINAVYSAKSWAHPPAWSIQRITRVHNQAVLTDALADPKGMLAIVPHLGAWELMNAWLNQFGAPTIMYKPVKGKTANDFVLAGRQRLNATLVPTDASGVKAIFQTLKKGGFSIVLPDHVPEPSGGVVVPFFGIETLSSTLASKLASKTQCRLVGLSCVRRTDGQGFEIFCDNLDDPNLYSKDMVVATTALNSAIEAMIRRFPHEYMWGYKRFKHNQFGRQDIYWLDIDTINQLDL